MKTDLKALRALCDAATDGEWLFSKHQNKRAYDGNYEIHKKIDREFVLCMTYTGDDPQEDEANARFIAATDPTTVRTLIDEIEKLQNTVKRLRDLNDAVIKDNKAMRELLREVKETLGFCETDFKQFYGDDYHERSTLGYIRKNLTKINQTIGGGENE